MKTPTKSQINNNLIKVGSDTKIVSQTPPTTQTFQRPLCLVKGWDLVQASSKNKDEGIKI